MSLIRMSFSASIMIIVIIILRTVLMNKLPKKTFLMLWTIVLLRLLIPFSFPSTFSIYFLISQNSTVMGKIADTPIAHLLPIHSYEQIKNTGMTADDNTEENTGKTAVSEEKNREQNIDTSGLIMQEAEKEQQIRIAEAEKENTDIQIPEMDNLSAWIVIWSIGFSVCTTIFSVTYFLCWKQFRTSLPVENAITKKWLVSHKMKRTISIRQSDCISTPMAYGFIHPVILLPKTINWGESKQLLYILEHEFIHIRRLDTVTKLFLIAVVCIHWFNPFVWALYFFANRDIELSCDETVVRYFGEDSKSAYAMSLIHMEEIKNTPMPFGNHFSRNTAEERITAIMKIQSPSVRADILAVVLIISITAAFTTSSFTMKEQGIGSIETAKRSGIQNATLFSGSGNAFSFLPPENTMDFQHTVFQEEKTSEDFFNAFHIIDFQTKLSIKQQKELLMEYQKHGVYEYNNILYYQNKPIRCLIDKYEEETVNKYGGTNYNTIRIYTYFNESGTIDVNTIREYKIGKTIISELYKEIMGMIGSTPAPIENVLVDLPRMSVNKLAQKAAGEGRYGELEKLVPFADTDILKEIAEKMMESGAEPVAIADYISSNSIG